MIASTSVRPARPATRPSREIPPPVRAWLAATILSGLPSTLYALARGTDPWEATRAAGAMLIRADAPLTHLVTAAAVVHGSVSAFWVLVLGATQPRRGRLPAAVLASAAIGLLDLKVIAPRLFPEVARLEFWPQLADHLMWGACVGSVMARADETKNDGRTAQDDGLVTRHV